MNYLQQYILESQIKYPNIFQHPISVLKHLLYTNGNGVEFISGNPVVYVQFYRTIPFSDYYKECLTRRSMIRELERDKYEEIERICNVKLKFKPNVESTDEIWKEAVDEYNDRYNDHTWVDNIPLENFFDEEKVLDMLYQSDKQFYHMLCLSDKYYQQCNLNENTDPSIIKIALQLSKAFVRYFSNITRENFDKSRNPFGRSQGHNVFKDYNGETVQLLKRDIISLEKIDKINDGLIKNGYLR